MNLEQNHLFNPREIVVLIPLTIPGYKCWDYSKDSLLFYLELVLNQ